MGKSKGYEHLAQWVTFGLDQETYAMDVMQVREVRRYSDIAPVPGAPSYVLGIINLRGHVVAVLDTRERFGLMPMPVTDQSRIMMIEINQQVIGVLVDRVAEVVSLNMAEIEPAPRVGNAETAPFIQGVCHHQGQLLILVDFSKLLSPQQWESVAERIE